jgi:Asp-tRNA(Asn)/Glu-tRNA(Gln) amidotransferase B subunit
MWCYPERSERRISEMSDNQTRILEMLEGKKISVDEAHRLLSMMAPEGDVTQEVQQTAAGRKAKYLRVTVAPRPGHQDDGEEDGGGELVRVRVPMSLIRAGMKLTALIPNAARDKIAAALGEKGIDLDARNLKPEEIEEMIEALSDLEVDVVNAREVVKVCVE